MSGWSEGRLRAFLYRAFVKTRVEFDRFGGPHIGFKRVIARPGRSNLSWLAAVYGSDKGATAHKYADLYEQHLAPMRPTAKRVLEIGVFRGASLQMWRDYFPFAEVYGVDIDDVTVEGSRIHTIRGDQSDPKLLAQLCELGPFDVVIDDGSHEAAHLLTTFRGLFEAVSPGGYYVIEDMHTAYLPEYGGGKPGAQETSVSLVQQLVDSVNREHVRSGYPAEAAVLVAADELHVYPKIAFVRRSALT